MRDVCMEGACSCARRGEEGKIGRVEADTRRTRWARGWEAMRGMR